MDNPYSLYNLSQKEQELDLLLDQLTDPDSEIDDEERAQLEEAYLNAFEELGDHITDKIDSYGVMQQIWKGVVDNCRHEYQRLAARRRVFEDKIDRNKERLVMYLIANDHKKVEGKLYTATLMAGRPIVEIYDEDALPDDCVREKVLIEPDKQEIARRIKNGEEVPGARLTDGNATVRIK